MARAKDSINRLSEIRVEQLGQRVFQRKPIASLMIGVLAWLVIAGLVNAFVSSPYLSWQVVGKYFFNIQILHGLSVTLLLFGTTAIIGYTLGIIVAAIRMAENGVLRSVATFYIWLFRSVPMLVQFLFWFNIAAIFPSIGIGLPFGSELSSLTQHLFGFAVHTTLFSVDANKVTSVMTVAIIAMGLHEVAYAAEVIRGGIASVDPSQRRAAVSLGLSRGRILRRIILPQAMRGMLPTLGNRAINIIKDSSLASVISLADLLYSAQLIYNRTFEVMPLLIVASLWYLVLTGLVDFIQKRLELRFGRGMTVE